MLGFFIGLKPEFAAESRVILVANEAAVARVPGWQA
jgi:hypothetical protein